MKHIKTIIAAVFLGLIFTACSSDDDTPDVNTDLLVGEWQLTALNAETEISISFLGQDITSTSTGEGSNFNYTVFINADNTITASGSYDYTVTANTDGQVITETATINEGELTGTWSVDGDQFISSGFFTGEIDNDLIDLESTDSAATITVLNETNLVLVADLESAIPTQDVEGVEYDVNGEGVYRLTRIN